MMQQPTVGLWAFAFARQSWTFIQHSKGHDCAIAPCPRSKWQEQALRRLHRPRSVTALHRTAPARLPSGPPLMPHSLSFTQGFLLGQLSIALLIFFFIKFFIFGEPPSADD